MAFKVHIVNIATLTDRAKYMINVSFGGDSATSPLLLKEGHITQKIGTQEPRLVYDSIPQQIDKSHKQLIYQYRNSGGQFWNSFFCFPQYEVSYVFCRVLLSQSAPLFATCFGSNTCKRAPSSFLSTLPSPGKDKR